MIKEITREQVLPLRSKVLRNGLDLEKCVFPTDDRAGIFHLGRFVNDQLISIATFFPEDYPEKGEAGFRLRGMATDPDFAGKGYGADLINFAVKRLTSANASYIWCNARKIAVGFYEKLGFEIVSAEFDIPGIGPHFDMLKKMH